MCEKYYLFIQLEIGVLNSNDVACLNTPLSLLEKQSFVFRINVIINFKVEPKRVYWNWNIYILVSLN